MKKVFFAIVLLCMSLSIVACMKDEKKDDETTTIPTTMVKKNDETTTVLQTTVINDDETTDVVGLPIDNKTKNEKLKISEEEILKLSNDKKECYFGNEVNAEGIPTASLTFQSQFEKYNADFIRNDNDEKTIYLTFDEGYENGYTGEILDVLKEKKVKAVFFITKPYAETEKDLVQRMIDEGHIVGNHSTSHPANGMISLSIEKQREDIQQLHDYVKENYNGYEMKLFRYPAGIFSEQSLAVLAKMGYTSVFWSFAHADWDPSNQPNESAALKKMIDKLHPGAIYLLHAVSKTNTDILGEFIDKAIEKDYKFEEY